MDIVKGLDSEIIQTWVQVVARLITSCIMWASYLGSKSVFCILLYVANNSTDIHITVAV